MDGTWVDKLRTVADRNRPRSKPQLWENFGLAVRRRLAFEVKHRVSPGWLDQPQTIELSGVGFDDGRPPLRMEIVPREVMSKALFLYGTFEISETRLFQAFLRPGMTLVDVGANIGCHTLLGARLVGPSGAVYSFEPNAAVRERLERNVALNGFDNVQVRAQAMAARSGELRFYVSAVPENTGISSIVPGPGLGTEGEVVDAVSLDDFAAQLGDRHIDLFKMDIEGAELQVIEGGRGLLARPDAPALLFESFKVEPLLEALRGLGYQIRRLHYQLATGLELPDADAPLRSLFDGYESPNYFAAKDPAVFAAVIARANAARSSSLRFLGRF
jgi:FkbM family methyltransferase